MTQVTRLRNPAGNLCSRMFLVCSFTIACQLSSPVIGAPPVGYYDGVDASDAASLRSTLHDVIDDHTRYPYTSSATDTWDILDAADEDPGNSSNVLDIYKNASYTKSGGGNSNYNREHVWPKSYGFPKNISSNYPYTDCHHLFLCNSSYNSSRSNKPYRDCDSGCSEKTTDVNDGRGGGSGTYSGNSNWTEGSGETGTWQTWTGRQGDVARALFYMDVRYEGGTHGVTSVSEPDLILTDNMTLLDADTQNNKSVAYMGKLSDLLLWHTSDEVDYLEEDHTDVVESYQGNRNPFIDHPEWVDCIFDEKCAQPWINELHYDNAGSDTGEFVEIAGLNGTNLTGWTLVAYNGANGKKYKTTNLSGAFTDDEGCMSAIAFAISGLQNGPDGVALVDASNNVVQFLSYEGEFTATDGPANGLTSSDIGVSESGSTSVGHSLQLSGTGDAYNHFEWQSASAETDDGSNTGQTLEGYCGVAAAFDDPWINEIHYDNSGADTGEFVEIAGEAGLSLSDWDIVAYNGSSGTSYKTTGLTGTIPDQDNGFGTLAFSISGLQNGAPDGLALVDDNGTVIQFLSYEGSFAATNGPADGLTSTNIGVSETGSTPAGHSVQLLGSSGCGYDDFTWQSPASDTYGSLNTSQSFSSSCP